VASAPAASASAEEPEPPWPAPDLASLQAVDEAPRPSPGHAGGRYTARTRASDAAAYRTAQPLPAGLVVCAEHADAAPGPTLCMRRERRGWRFGVALPGRPGWARVGALDECAGCHGTAPRDGVFGP
jgi:hypothetical protein